jgi:multiple sugar transport system ATP-binding protein
MTMGNRVAVMRKGEIQQVASPQELYDRPVNLFVGGFIGSPAMNMLDATVQRTNGTVSLKLSDDQSLEVDRACLAAHPALTAYEGRTVVLGIRPETLEEASLARDTPATRRLKGRVELREALGSELMVHVAVPHAQLADTEETKELARESTVEGGLETAGALIVGRFSPHARVEEGATVEVAVDTSLLHFFDPDTGLGIYEQGNEKGAST